MQAIVEFEETLVDKYVEKIKDRLLFQNKNWLAIICGETGSSKSYSALRLGELIGNVYYVFTPKEFMQLINNKKLKRGDCIVFDEAGVGIPSRDWQSLQNKLFGAVLQTFRNMNIAVIFTTPNLSFIDVQARKLFHAFIETDYIDRKEEIAYVRPYDIQINVKLDKTYMKSPFFFDTVDGSIIYMNKMGLRKPSEKLRKRYERDSAAYKQKVREDTLKALEEAEKPPRTGGINDNNNIKRITEAVLEKNDITYARGMDARTRIRMEFNVGEHTAKAVQSLLRGKIKDGSYNDKWSSHNQG